MGSCEYLQAAESARTAGRPVCLKLFCRVAAARNSKPGWSLARLARGENRFTLIMEAAHIGGPLCRNEDARSCPGMRCRRLLDIKPHADFGTEQLNMLHQFADLVIKELEKDRVGVPRLVPGLMIM